MSTVRIVHPEAGEAEVPESAVPEWRSSGWEIAPEPERSPEYVVNAEDARRFEGELQEAAKTDEDDKPSRSRRRSNEESE